MDARRRSSDHHYRCRVSSAVVYPSRTPGLVVDWAHSLWRMCLARSRPLGASQRMVRKSHRQSLSLERLLADAPIPLRLRHGAVSAPRGGWQALWSRWSRLDAQSTARSQASAREPWLLAHSPQLRTLRAEEIVALYAAAHADRGELPRQQVHPIGYGTRGQSIALGATVACAAPDWYLGGVSALAHRTVGRGRRITPADSKPPTALPANCRSLPWLNSCVPSCHYR